jgi:UDP-glucose 4-epimerase
MKIAGRIPLPVIHWLAYWSKPFLPGSACNVLAPIELDYLRYPWVADTTRMHQVMNFAPRYTAVEALREFSGLQRLRKYLPESAARAYDEERLRDTLERRRRIRERSGMEAVQEMEIIDE